jgi:hypothetical protein
MARFEIASVVSPRLFIEYTRGVAKVEFRSGTGRTLDVMPIDFEPFDDADGTDPFRVRHLIAKLVTESVKDFHLREKDRAFSLLTPEKIEKGLETGKIGSPREEQQEVDLDSAIEQALQAFEDRLYLLFVDQNEKRDLDDLVIMQPDTDITIIRLTALAGR